MSELSEFIQELTNMRNEKSELIKVVRYPKLLISGLQDLENMVGMIGLKSQIIKQIKFLIVTGHRQSTQNLIRNEEEKSNIIDKLRNDIHQSTSPHTDDKKDDKGKMEGHMLHALLCGNPGTGKTTVAKILCRIWIALNLIKTSTKNKTLPNGTSVDNCCPPTIPVPRLVLSKQIVPTVPVFTPLSVTDAQLLKDKIEKRILEIDLSLKENQVQDLKKNIGYDLKYLKDIQNKINRKKTIYKNYGNNINYNNTNYTGRISTLIERNREENKNYLYFLNQISSDLRYINSKITSHLNKTDDKTNSSRSSTKSSSLPKSNNLSKDKDDNVLIRTQTEIIPYFNIFPVIPPISVTPAIPPIPIIPIIPTIEYIEEEAPKDEDLPFKIITRENLVAKYVGQTAPLTMATLTSCLGHVVLIDEAYLLYHNQNSGDSFGMEALTLINEFMSKHAGEIIIIFAGYKELMKETIFKAQPGLQRRCGWTFEIDAYSAKELAEIFRRQLKKDNWEVKMVSLSKEEILEKKRKLEEEETSKKAAEEEKSRLEEIKQKEINDLEQFVLNVLCTNNDNNIQNEESETQQQVQQQVQMKVIETPVKRGIKRKREEASLPTLEQFFEQNIDSFPNGGGDTERLCYNAKLAHASYAYSCMVQKKEIPSFIDFDMLKIAFETLNKSHEHTGKGKDKFEHPPPSMYN
jgi:DNA polymerase III delta prime subunit